MYMVYRLNMPIYRVQNAVCKSNLQKVFFFKSDLQNVVCKSNLQNVVCKPDPHNVVCKSDLRNVVCKSNLQNVVRKSNLEKVVCKSDLQNVVCKSDLQMSFLSQIYKMFIQLISFGSNSCTTILLY